MCEAGNYLAEIFANSRQVDFDVTKEKLLDHCMKRMIFDIKSLVIYISMDDPNLKDCMPTVWFDNTGRISPMLLELA